MSCCCGTSTGPAEDGGPERTFTRCAGTELGAHCGQHTPSDTPGAHVIICPHPCNPTPIP